MRNRRFAKILTVFFFLPLMFLVIDCSRQRVASKRLPAPHEKRAEGKGVFHTIQRHQNLYRICKTYGVDMKVVASLNNIADPDKIQAGQRIFIPGAKKVLRVEIVIDDVVAEPVENGKEKERPKTAHQKMDFIRPVEGKCINFFEDSEKRKHQGIDIAAPTGTPIRASGAGRVIYSGDTIRGYGNLIILRHSDQFVTVYAHNQVNLVKEGMKVDKGQVIGRVGQTGRASGPHLHFEIRINNKAVDPMLYLR